MTMHFVKVNYTTTTATITIMITIISIYIHTHYINKEKIKNILCTQKVNTALLAKASKQAGIMYVNTRINCLLSKVAQNYYTKYKIQMCFIYICT